MLLTLTTSLMHLELKVLTPRQTDFVNAESLSNIGVNVNVKSHIFGHFKCRAQDIFPADSLTK